MIKKKVLKKKRFKNNERGEKKYNTNWQSLIHISDANIRVGEPQLSKILSHLSVNTPSNRPSLARGAGVTISAHGSGGVLKKHCNSAVS